MSGTATWETLAAGGESAAGKTAKAIGKRLAGRAILAPLGPIGLGIGAALLLYDVYELYNTYNESHQETEDKPAEECAGECEKEAEYPSNPDDLLDEGWIETSHPNAKEKGHRTFENPETGEKVRFDKGKPGETGWEKVDHYHRFNPNKTGRGDEYLDSKGRPVPKGSDASHIKPKFTGV